MASLTAGSRRKALLQFAVDRQKHLESLMPLGPVLALAPGARAMADAISLNSVELSEWLDRLDGRAQFQLTVGCDHALVPQRFSDQVQDKGQGVPDRLATELSNEIDALVSPVVQDSVSLPLDGEGMLLNRVLLIEARDELELDAAIERIDAIWPTELNIRLIGPSPAVSFALGMFRYLPATEIGRAANSLGIGLDDRLTGKKLTELATKMGSIRRRALMSRKDPSTVSLLERVCQLPLPPGELRSLYLLDVRREGCADPVKPASLPPVSNVEARHA